MTTPMTYDEVRDKVKNGDIVYLWTPPLGQWKNWRAIIFPLVKFFTGSPIYHCGVAIWMDQPNGTKRLMLVESNLQGGKKVLPLSYYAPRKMEIHALPEAYSFEHMETPLMANIGTQPYSILAFLGVGVREYFGLPARDYAGQICSELCAQAWIDAGAPLIETLVSPGKLHGQIIKLGIPITYTTIPYDGVRQD